MFISMGMAFKFKEKWVMEIEIAESYSISTIYNDIVNIQTFKTCLLIGNNDI